MNKEIDQYITVAEEAMRRLSISIATKELKLPPDFEEREEFDALLGSDRRLRLATAVIDVLYVLRTECI